MDTIRPRAAGYVRTAGGTEGLAEQRTAIEKYAKKYGYQLAGVFEDRGVPGTTATGERPGFQHVVRLAEDGHIDLVIVHRLDRIGSDLARVVPAVEWLRDQEVELRSVTERIDTSMPPNAAALVTLATLGTAPPDDAAILRRVYDLRRRGRSTKGITATPDQFETPRGEDCKQ